MSYSSRFFHILLDSVIFFQILVDSSRFFQILPDSFRFFQILSDSSRFFQILPDSFRFFQILSDSFRFFQILPDSFRFFQILSDSCFLMGVIRRNQVLGDLEWTGVEAASMPETSGLERVSWAIAHALEDLVVEVGDLRKSVMD